MNKIRLRGLLKLVGGCVLFVLIFSNIYNNGLGDPSKGNLFKLIAIGFPGAIALVGLIETLTGLPFSHISNVWDNLTSWQRGVYGLLVVVVAFIAVFFVLVPILGEMLM